MRNVDERQPFAARLTSWMRVRQAGKDGFKLFCFHGVEFLHTSSVVVPRRELYAKQARMPVGSLPLIRILFSDRASELGHASCDFVVGEFRFKESPCCAS